MKNAEKTTPNYVLRKERELRGWSQNYLAERLDAPSPSYISRWERGTAFPSPYYREKLCRVFDKNAEELGLIQQLKETNLSIEESSETISLPTEDQDATISNNFQEEVTSLPTTRPEKISIYDQPEQIAQKPFWRKRPFIIGTVVALLGVFVTAPILFFAYSHPGTQPIKQSVTPANAVTTTPAVISHHTWPTYSYDETTRKENVRTIQYMLKDHGFDVGSSGADGLFGPKTEYAVRKFQETRKLPATGIVEQKTWERLIISSQVGKYGNFVLALQRQLNASSIHSKLKLNSSFDTTTKNALVQYQKAKNLPASGRADLNTWCLLIGGTIK